jgi:hypothetical protein
MVREHSIDLQALGISMHNLAALESPFSEKEVCDIIKQLPSDKAPGPDGYTGEFYMACWSIIKQDIMNAMSAVCRRKFINFDKVNSAFITLVPKKIGADMSKISDR